MKNLDQRRLARLQHSEPIKNGDVAQLGERKHGMFQVAGSIPVISTKKRYPVPDACALRNFSRLS